MENEPEIVQIKLDETRQQQTTTVIKARQIKLSNNKTVIAYNHINGYILDAPTALHGFSWRPTMRWLFWL